MKQVSMPWFIWYKNYILSGVVHTHHHDHAIIITVALGFKTNSLKEYSSV